MSAFQPIPGGCGPVGEGTACKTIFGRINNFT